MIKIQEALKSIELAEETGSIQYLLDALNDCKATLSDIEKCYGSRSPVSEPVGEVSVDYQGFMSYKQLKDLPEGYHKVYTSPKPREWVGLNRNDLRMIFFKLDSMDKYAIAKAIEAKCKQLNTKG